MNPEPEFLCGCLPTWGQIDLGLDGWSQLDQGEEPMGTKEKSWWSDPVGRPWLFKFARSAGGAVRGEDWAEWLTHRLALALGVPTACAHPAVLAGRRGILSRSVVGTSERLEHGNELLARVDPAYDKGKRRPNPGYTVAAVAAALVDVGPPADFPRLADLSGFDVWAGYLVLDAVVAGRDRHHENWATIRTPSSWRLSPSFDHGNALGFQESPDRLDELVRTGSVVTWANRGRSHHFAAKPLLTAVALEALDRSPAASRYWRERLANLDLAPFTVSVASVPDDVMSAATRTFVSQLIKLNLERMRHGD